ncbi:MAG TPA: cell division protein ZapA [Terriglobales bacterium]|nr:cell division protein ZapA [Candidatus Acidoferrum sp.]HWQ51160.1 cell division protein ZapA [Terriglobales bacterium]
MKNKLNVKILDTVYNVSSNESEEYVEKVARQVDHAMRAVLEADTRSSVTVAAIFAALGFCDEKLKAEIASENLRSQLKSYLEDMNKLRAEAEDARKEAARLTLEASQLRTKLARFEAGN